MGLRSAWGWGLPALACTPTAQLQPPGVVVSGSPSCHWMSSTLSPTLPWESLLGNLDSPWRRRGGAAVAEAAELWARGVRCPCGPGHSERCPSSSMVLPLSTLDSQSRKCRWLAGGGWGPHPLPGGNLPL